jgi:hypothetical protein
MSETIQQVQQAFTAYTIERELGAGGMATVLIRDFFVGCKCSMPCKSTRESMRALRLLVPHRSGTALSQCPLNPSGAASRSPLRMQAHGSCW